MRRIAVDDGLNRDSLQGRTPADFPFLSGTAPEAVRSLAVVPALTPALVPFVAKLAPAQRS